MLAPRTKKPGAHYIVWNGRSARCYFHHGTLVRGIVDGTVHTQPRHPQLVTYPHEYLERDIVQYFHDQGSVDVTDHVYDLAEFYRDILNNWTQCSPKQCQQVKNDMKHQLTYHIQIALTGSEPDTRQSPL